LRHCGASRKVAGFFTDFIHPVTLWPGVDSASKRNEYQEHLWGWEWEGVGANRLESLENSTSWNPRDPSWTRLGIGLLFPQNKATFISLNNINTVTQMHK